LTSPTYAPISVLQIRINASSRRHPHPVCSGVTMSKARPNARVEVKISPVCSSRRERHVKCDGGPQCSRRKQDGALCPFRPFRREMRPSSRPRLRPSSDACPSDVALPAQAWIPSQRPMLALSDNSSPQHCLGLALRSQSGFCKSLAEANGCFHLPHRPILCQFLPGASIRAAEEIFCQRARCD
jgi:hypothetical protein